MMAAGTGLARADAPTAADLPGRLAAIEKAIDGKRRDLHIPGASLVIVKDDRIAFIKGFGERDVEKHLPVTPDTLFAIGSSTKAFTAMTVLMSADDGKMALTDSPRKFLPDFRLFDESANSKITIEDLLCHRSGLTRTDVAWYVGRFDARDTRRLIADIRPTAKLGQKFQYQNLMFMVAGQCVGAAQKQQWTDVLKQRVFRPLGMHRSNASISELEKFDDRSLGYRYDLDSHEFVTLPYHRIDVVAPAGAINSSARDMAQWLRFLLAGGAINGKRLLSESKFAELSRSRIQLAPKIGYSLGWFIRDWNGHQVLEHGGNIDGFNAQVAIMPDQHLGFVLLTNVTASPLGSVAMDTVWDNLVGKPAEAPTNTPAVKQAAAPPEEAATYHSDLIKLDITIRAAEGKLFAKATGQPELPLENVGGRRYRVAIQGDSIYVTFQPSTTPAGKTELLLEQGGVKLVFARKAANAAAGAKLTLDEVMARAIEAQGGEAALRRHRTRVVQSVAKIEAQGLSVTTTTYARAPYYQSTVQRLYALNRLIGSTRDYFDGKNSGTESSFAKPQRLSEKRVAENIAPNYLFPELDWKTRYKSVTLAGQEKIGDEDAYVVTMQPAIGQPITDYIAATSFRVIRRKAPTFDSDSGAWQDLATDYADFRKVGDITMPFVETIAHPAFGPVWSFVRRVELDRPIADSVFAPSQADEPEGR